MDCFIFVLYDCFIIVLYLFYNCFMVVSKAIAQTSRHSGVIPWKQTPVQSFVRDGLPAYIRPPKGFCFLAVASATKRAKPGGRPHPVCPPRTLHARALSHCLPSCCMPALSSRPFCSAAAHFFVATLQPVPVHPCSKIWKTHDYSQHVQRPLKNLCQHVSPS